MRFDISIKNLGKISDAEIKIRPFTVIAGKNSSGKSFVTKSLYSIFNTINKDYISIKAYESIETLRFISEDLSTNTPRISQKESKLIGTLSANIDTLDVAITQSFGRHTFANQLTVTHQLKEPIERTKTSINALKTEISKKNKYAVVSNYFEMSTFVINNLTELTESPVECLIEGVTKELTGALKENFQVSNLTELKNFHFPDNKHIDFDLGTLGKVKIAGENLEFTLSKTSIDEIQKLHNIVYLESPVYWKMSQALKEVKYNTRKGLLHQHKKGSILTGVPKHFYDLLNLIDTRTTAPSIELYLSLNEEIGGEISISSTGSLSYIEKNSNAQISLHNTALGVTNLGIISLLLKKGVLSKGSFLFIDEPEVHLHPLWQKTMVETLYALSKSGVNVVIASHSIDMMKCIENIMEKLPDDEINDHFGINKLDLAGKSIGNSSFPLRQLADIQADLGESFSEMVMENNFDWNNQ